MAEITASELRESLSYDSTTGVFRWRIVPRRLSKMESAGRKDRHGRIQIQINGRKYFAHRLAWLYTFGSWPQRHIDHIDRDPGNNCLENLRLATRSQNQGNSRLPRNNSSGVKGVRQVNGRWRARIIKRNKEQHLGCFDSLSEAAAAYEAAANEYFGEFAYPATRI